MLKYRRISEKLKCLYYNEEFARPDLRDRHENQFCKRPGYILIDFYTTRVLWEKPGKYSATRTLSHRIMVSHYIALIKRTRETVILSFGAGSLMPSITCPSSLAHELHDTSKFMCDSSLFLSRSSEHFRRNVMWFVMEQDSGREVQAIILLGIVLYSCNIRPEACA